MAHPDVGIPDHMSAGLPPECRGLIKTCIALLFNYSRALGDRILEQLHHVSFRFVNLPRRVLYILSKVRANFDPVTFPIRR